MQFPPHLARYERQMLFEPVGVTGQERLCEGLVLVAGVGALGTVAASMLVRAGVSVRLADHDVVELSNLQRQALYDEADVAAARPKVLAAADKLRAANSDVTVETVAERIDRESAARLAAGVDVILDGVDNFAAKFALNEAAARRRIPYIYGAISGTYGLMKVIRAGDCACLGCLYRDEPDADSSETAGTAGVLAPVVNVIASLQVLAALKLLAGCEDEITDDLFQVDVWDGEMRRIPVTRRSDCAMCGGMSP